MVQSTVLESVIKCASLRAGGDFIAKKLELVRRKSQNQKKGAGKGRVSLSEWCNVTSKKKRNEMSEDGRFP